MLGLDYAGGRPGGVTIKAAGYDFVCRYLTSGGAGLPGKLLTIPEYADLQEHGVAIVANFETSADRMKAGFDAGVQDASAADTVLRALGHPADRPVYFSADFDATPADQAEIDDYLRGAASVIGADRVGVYGGYWIVKRCLDNHTARWAWQTGAWSGGNIDPRIHIYQRIGFVTVGGVECDVNEARQVDFGQHPTPTPPPMDGDNMQNFQVQGTGTLPLICPVGKASAITKAAWVSACSNGPSGGKVRYWFQSDTGGIADESHDIVFANGHSTRPWAQLPDGATMLRIDYQLLSGGTICLETQPK